MSEDLLVFLFSFSDCRCRRATCHAVKRKRSKGCCFSVVTLFISLLDTYISCSFRKAPAVSFTSWELFWSKLFSGWWQLAALVWKEEKTKHSVLRGCVWLMTEVCVAVGTLGAATDQSSCKTNLTLTNPPPHLLPPHQHQTLSSSQPSAPSTTSHS